MHLFIIANNGLKRAALEKTGWVKLLGKADLHLDNYGTPEIFLRHYRPSMAVTYVLKRDRLGD